ncbi:MAG: hypothetical protein QXW55_04415 [Candidatus Bathyarchaeia archaeon]
MIKRRGIKINNREYAANLRSGAKINPTSILYITLPLALAICLRVYPFLLSGLPFSVDAWPSIKCAENLLKNSHTVLNAEVPTSEELGDKIFGAVISAIMGLQPITTMAFYLPIAGAMVIPILCALVKKVYGRGEAFAASILLATAAPEVILTAGVKGQTYAHPLYMTLILLFLNRGMGFWRKVLLFSLLSMILALTHYYTAIFIAAAFVFMGVAKIILRWKDGKDLEVDTLIFPIILAISVFAYLTFYASWAFRFISSIDWISAASYQLVLFVLALYLTLKPQGTKHTRTTAFSIIASLIALLLAFLATRRPLVAGAPTLPMYYLLYAAPFIIAAPLAVLGYAKSKSLKRSNNGDERVVLPLFWLGVILGLECYAIFGNVEAGLGLTLAYRGLVFLIPPLSILCAIGLASLPRDKETGKWGFSRVQAAMVLAAILALNLYSFYATIFIQERYMGYFWLYTPSEYYAAVWISEVTDGLKVAGDAKTLYLLKYYFNADVNLMQGLKFLSGASKQAPEILFMYSQMLRNGYVVYGGYSVNLPEGWLERLHNLSLVYSNIVVNVYAR